MAGILPALTPSANRADQHVRVISLPAFDEALRLITNKNEFWCERKEESGINGLRENILVTAGFV
jgi:hypothetical protein